MPTPLKILLLSDGRPGHFNLSEGVVAAAERLRPVAVERRIVQRGRWPGTVLAGWSNSGWAPERLLRVAYGIEPGGLPVADLVLSAGAETLAANVACARTRGAANIFYGSLRWFQPRDFSLALTSYASDCRHPNQAFALKPSPAAINAWQRRRAAPPRVDEIGILIGGPSGEMSYTAQDWQRLIDLIEWLGRRTYRCLVANSRRTPAEVSDRLAALAAHGDGPIAQFIDARQPDAPSLLPILERASWLFVTDDSSSMVSEAVAAGVPVIGLSPARRALERREAAYRQMMIDAGWYDAMPLGAPADDLLAAAASRRPRGEDPVAAIAHLLKERLPGLFLPTAAAAARS